MHKNGSQQLASLSFYERNFAVSAVKLLPGEYFATADAVAITTLLGSCVSVCLYDNERGVGGMNHFMLPKIWQKENSTRCSPPYAPPCSNRCSARYGECAFKQLLERLEFLGARRANLEAKLFGGGKVMAGGADIGGKNAAFAIGYLKERNIPIVSADMGDCFPRKVIFFPNTGRVYVKRLPKESIGTI